MPFEPSTSTSSRSAPSPTTRPRQPSAITALHRTYLLGPGSRYLFVIAISLITWIGLTVMAAECVGDPLVGGGAVAGGHAPPALCRCGPTSASPQTSYPARHP